MEILSSRLGDLKVFERDSIVLAARKVFLMLYKEIVRYNLVYCSSLQVYSTYCNHCAVKGKLFIVHCQLMHQYTGHVKTGTKHPNEAFTFGNIIFSPFVWCWHVFSCNKLYNTCKFQKTYHNYTIPLVPMAFVTH